jgi:hypothetical protein
MNNTIIFSFTNILEEQQADEDRGCIFFRNSGTNQQNAWCKGKGTPKKLATAIQPQFPD